jgi:adenylosuccinate synthase
VELSAPPAGAEALATCAAIYQDMPGWQESTAGIRHYEDLPVNACRYLQRLEELTETPIVMVSTSPERADTIVRQDPFA